MRVSTAFRSSLAGNIWYQQQNEIQLNTEVGFWSKSNLKDQTVDTCECQLCYSVCVICPLVLLFGVLQLYMYTEVRFVPFVGRCIAQEA